MLLHGSEGRDGILWSFFLLLRAKAEKGCHQLASVQMSLITDTCICVGVLFTFDFRPCVYGVAKNILYVGTSEYTTSSIEPPLDRIFRNVNKQLISRKI